MAREAADSKRNASDLVRIIAAALGSLLAGVYVLSFNAVMAAVQSPCNFSADRLAHFPALTQLCYAAGPYWLAMPVITLAAGLWFRRKGRLTLVAVVVSATWLASATWVLLIQLAWIIPAYPLCGPVRP